MAWFRDYPVREGADGIDMTFTMLADMRDTNATPGKLVNAF